MEIQVRPMGKVCVFDLTGRMTLGEGDVTVRNAIRERMGKGDLQFLLNLKNITFLDSAGIGEIVASLKRVREAGGDIKLILSHKAHDVFLVTRLNFVFDIFEDEKSALASYS